MKISAIRVEVTPWTLSYTGAFELHIKVQTANGKEAVLSHIVERNDLECFFDQTWKCLGETIKDYWRKEDEKQSTDKDCESKCEKCDAHKETLTDLGKIWLPAGKTR